MNVRLLVISMVAAYMVSASRVAASKKRKSDRDSKAWPFEYEHIEYEHIEYGYAARFRSMKNTPANLTCNQCSMGLFGTCLIPDSVECHISEPNCYTGKAEFPSISGFLGFNTQGCLDSASCNITTNGTILGATYTVTRTCCATDKCNPVTIISGADSVHLSLTAALSAALVASVWGSWQY